MRDCYLHVPVDDAEVVEVAEGEDDFGAVEARARLRERAALLRGGGGGVRGGGAGDRTSRQGKFGENGAFRQISIPLYRKSSKYEQFLFVEMTVSAANFPC